MTDQVKALIAAAEHAYEVYKGEAPASRVNDSMAKLLKAIAAAKAAAEARPEPAAEPSEIARMLKAARDMATAGLTGNAVLFLIDAVEALAREVLR